MVHSKGYEGCLFVLRLPCARGGGVDWRRSGETVQGSENGRARQLPIPRPGSKRVRGHRIVPCIRSVHEVKYFRILACSNHLLSLTPLCPSVLKPHLVKEKIGDVV